jgi:hypothetical protein
MLNFDWDIEGIHYSDYELSFLLKKRRTLLLQQSVNWIQPARDENLWFDLIKIEFLRKSEVPSLTKWLSLSQEKLCSCT